jgi:hypothetical protein
MAKTSNELIEKIIKILEKEKGLLKRSGRSFYSSIDTIKKGRYFILGLNPGGHPEIEKDNIEKSFSTIEKKDWNAYYEVWNGKKDHRLQKNLIELFKHIDSNLCLKNVCSTNLIYERTQSEKKYFAVSGNERLLKEVYVKILKEVLGVIQPEVIFTFGERPFLSLCNHYGIKAETIQKVHSGHGNWMIQLAKGYGDNKKLKIFKFPHLSRYVLYNKPDKLDWIKKTIVEFNN